MLVGLSGSGKTTYLSTFGFNDNKKYTVIDDCMSSPLWLQNTRTALEQGKHVIVSDPRFCNLKYMEIYYNVLSGYRYNTNIIYFKFTDKAYGHSKKYFDNKAQYLTEYVNTIKYIKSLKCRSNGLDVYKSS
jgi:predicted kinase